MFNIRSSIRPSFPIHTSTYPQNLLMWGPGKVTLYSLLPKIQNIVNPRHDLVKMEGEGGRNKKLVPPTPPWVREGPDLHMNVRPRTLLYRRTDISQTPRWDLKLPSILYEQSLLKFLRPQFIKEIPLKFKNWNCLQFYLKIPLNWNRLQFCKRNPCKICYF